MSILPEYEETPPITALSREQRELEQQQKAEKDQLKKQLEQQRIAALRGRFSGSGGGDSGGDTDSSSLYSKLTGR